VAVSGRDLSLDAKSKYELFRSNMYYHALRTTPREVLMSDKELETQHAEQRAHQRSAHEERVRALIQVSSYCYMCVLIPLYMCPHPPTYACAHTTTYVSSYSSSRARPGMRPHTLPHTLPVYEALRY